MDVNVPTLPIEGAIADDSSTVEAATSGKLSPEEFVNKVLANHRAKYEAWVKAGKPEITSGKVDTSKYEKYAGCHTVYSGFNTAFRRYYGEGIDPVVVTKELASCNLIVSKPSRGGAMLYSAGTRGVDKGNDLLADLGLDAA